ncbi:MAG: hypothetical protein IJS08_03620 [Victivallales bacterium]|nr:hypothetical protein [Victivallales bacterium]
MKKAVNIVFAIVALLLASCNSMIPQTRFKLALHQVVSEAERDNANSSLIVTARSIDGSKKRMIRSFPMIDSRHILKIDVLRQDKGNRAALKIYFDDFAPGLWSEVQSVGGKLEVAMIVDGFISGFMELPRELDADGALVTPPLWSLAEARLIAENVQRNYKIINKR